MAERVTCHYCGLPFKVRRVEPGQPVYCCSGCAVAARIPAQGGDWPLTAELGLACAAGFLFFNQVLLEVLAGLMRGDGREVTADRIHLAGLGLGVVVWLLLAIFQWRSGARRAIDGVVLAVTGLTLGAALFTSSAWCAAGAVAGLMLWAARGLGRKRRPNSVDA